MSEFANGVQALLGVDVVATRPVGGGCISDARRFELADGRVVFAKSGTGLAAGWRDLLPKWQLEPLLVHTTLFGGSYGAQAHDILRRFT